MGMFKKEICCVCGKKAGLLQRTKLEDDQYLCINCSVNYCSSFLKRGNYTKEQIMEHMDNLKKHEELYINEFKKDGIFKFHGKGITISFSDELGLFSIYYDDEGQKFHEMFRYDQISNYYIRTETDVNDAVKLSRVDVVLELENHPYCDKIRIMCAIKQNEMQTVKETVAEPLIKKLDEIFGKPHEEIKEKIRSNLTIGLGGINISTAGIAKMSKFIKNGLGEDESVKENEKFVRNNRTQYTQRANETEKKYGITI